MTEQAEQQTDEQEQEQHQGALEGIGCIAVIVIAVVLAVYVLLINGERISTGLSRVLSGGPTATPTMSVAEMIEATPDLCPEAQTQTCPARWSDDEMRLVDEYKARVRPVALALAQVAAGVRSLSAAHAKDADVVGEMEWRQTARTTFDLLQVTIDTLRADTPGSIAGTHARLIYAAALLQGCQVEWDYWRGADDWGDGNPYPEPLACVRDGLVDRAEQEILLAIADLGG